MKQSKVIVDEAISTVVKQITGPQIADGAARVWDQLNVMNLVPYAAQLEIMGYTVVPPEATGMRPGWVSEARDAIYSTAERRNGTRPSSDTDTREEHGLGITLPHILVEDPVFEEALLNPVALALSELIVGRRAVIGASVGMLKGPGNSELPLHTDALTLPSPFPSTCSGVNMTWALTPYTQDDGCLCVVPGSHRLFRHPLDGEGIDQRVPVEAAEGSLIIWGQYLWHGALARKNSGLRANLINTLQRTHMRSREAWDDIPEERRQANPERFTELVAAPWGWKKEGPQSKSFPPSYGCPYD